MKRPYLKKYKNINGFAVWIVDGTYIRRNIDEEFTNFGQHYKFDFIPKNELWIDKENGKISEKKYYINTMITINKLMARGMKRAKAIKIADKNEKLERRKELYYKRKITFNDSYDKKIKRIHLGILKKYSNNLRVWVVDGDLVRDCFFIDFTEGGHEVVYKFVPKNEIWIDNDLSPKERKFVLLHEVHERNRMLDGLKYNAAHHESSLIEFDYRHNSKDIDKKIKEEFKIAEKKEK